MPEYPKTLAVTVNSPEQEQQVIGFTQPKQEFPKMVYLHPADKTHQHKYIVVNNDDELGDAQNKGYRLDPHVPQVNEDFDEAPGSGNLRYEAGDWTQTTGEGLTADTETGEAPLLDQTSNEQAADNQQNEGN